MFVSKRKIDQISDEIKRIKHDIHEQENSLSILMMKLKVNYQNNVRLQRE